MRKLVVLLTVTMLILSSCSFLDDARDEIFDTINEELNVIGPETVMIDDVVYRSGFYGDLWPRNLSYSGDPTTIGKNDFYHVDNDRFDWVHSDIGVDDCGVLYCAENQWEQACSYYSDSDNFTYYCRITRNGSLQRQYTVADMDLDKFNALFDFAKANDYNPFATNPDIETQDLPLPDYDVSPILVFYCESNDGFYTAYKGYSYHIINGKLYKVFQYRHGDEQVLRAVEVPEEFGDYFVKLVMQLEEEY